MYYTLYFKHMFSKIMLLVSVAFDVICTMSKQSKNPLWLATPSPHFRDEETEAQWKYSRENIVHNTANLAMFSDNNYTYLIMYNCQSLRCTLETNIIYILTILLFLKEKKKETEAQWGNVGCSELNSSNFRPPSSKCHASLLCRPDHIAYST